MPQVQCDISVVESQAAGSTGDESPVYGAAPDESGFAVRSWVQCIVTGTGSSSEEARFSGRSRMAWQLQHRAGVRELCRVAGYRRSPAAAHANYHPMRIRPHGIGFQASPAQLAFRPDY